MIPVPLPDQILALAPDASAVKAARELASARRWTGLGRSDELLWGLAQGSGKDPYQVRVALTDHASKCSCPSRKFPCKHALGLMLLAAENPAATPDGPPPPFALEWQQERAQRSQQQEARKAQQGGPRSVDSAQQARRQERREGRIEDGAALLQQTLVDLLRSGLAAAASTTPLWPDLERRMVDAQAPGLAACVQTLRELLQSGAARRDEALDELGRLQTLLSALARADRLPPPLQRSLWQAIGVPVRSEEVLQHAGVDDVWYVAAIDTFAQDHLVTVVQWLLGQASGTWASVVHSTPAAQRGGERLPLGGALQGELVFAPTAAPQRAWFRTPPRPVPAPAPAPTAFAEVLARHATALAAEPWRRSTPFLVAARPGTVGDQPVLIDATGAAMPWSPRGDVAWQLHAICGGEPMPISGVHDGRRLRVLAARDVHGIVDFVGAPA